MEDRVGRRGGGKSGLGALSVSGTSDLTRISACGPVPAHTSSPTSHSSSVLLLASRHTASGHLCGLSGQVANHDTVDCDCDCECRYTHGA
jgi:hypothetical protein